MNEQQAKMTPSNQSLGSFLIQPVQRIPRYQSIDTYSVFLSPMPLLLISNINNSLLILIFLRYVLLLAELEKNTHPSHPDFNCIVEAALELKKTADFINESKKQSEGVVCYSFTFFYYFFFLHTFILLLLISSINQETIYLLILSYLEYNISRPFFSSLSNLFLILNRNEYKICVARLKIIRQVYYFLN